MSQKTWGVVFIGAGLVILFAGDQLANVGDAVDQLLQSKVTGAALVGVGVLLFAGASKKALAI